MPYMFSIGGASANQTYQSFKLANQIASMDDSINKVKVLKSFYMATIKKAESSDQFASIPLIPPSNNAWTWDDSLRLATQAARKAPNTYITICIPENVSFTLDGIISNDFYTSESSMKKYSWLYLHGMCEDDRLNANEILQSLANISEIRKNIVFEERDNKNQEIDETLVTAINTAGNQLIEQINGTESKTFAAELESLLENASMTVSQLSVSSNLPEYIIENLLNGKFIIPKKNEAIAIGIGLRLTHRLFNKFLSKCGYSLSDFLINDVVISWCLTNGLKNIDVINKMLLLCTGEIIAGENIKQRNNTNILDDINEALVPSTKPDTSNNPRCSDIGDDDLIFE